MITKEVAKDLKDAGFFRIQNNLINNGVYAPTLSELADEAGPDLRMHLGGTLSSASKDMIISFGPTLEDAVGKLLLKTKV